MYHKSYFLIFLWLFFHYFIFFFFPKFCWNQELLTNYMLINLNIYIHTGLIFSTSSSSFSLSWAFISFVSCIIHICGVFSTVIVLIFHFFSVLHVYSSMLNWVGRILIREGERKRSPTPKSFVNTGKATPQPIEILI